MTRTKSGCWTCRLRTKKKCDEATPTCDRCVRLGVHCFGYGPPPSKEELSQDRRALIAMVGLAARTKDSKFRVWRLKQTLDRPQQDASKTRPEQLVSKLKPQPHNDSARPFADKVALHCRQAASPTALDRVNSGMIDLLHPQLLTHYTDDVFWLNSRFYQTPGPYSGNSWVKAFLTRDQSTHLAAATMGLTFVRLFERSNMYRLAYGDITRTLAAMHSLVIQSVKDQLVRALTLTAHHNELITVGATLAKCASLLLMFETWRMGGNPMPHLRGMSDIITWLASEAPAEMSVAMKVKTRRDVVGEEFDLVRVAPIPDTILNYLALKWFVQAYTWVDISAVIWLGPHYIHHRCHRFYAPYLKYGHLQMERNMGCEDWVLYAILIISETETRSVDQPSELGVGASIREAEAWHQKLQTSLEFLLIRRDQYPLGLDRDATFVTEMWLHAALVFLHVVTIGPRSDHLRLRQYVARSLIAYENLPRRFDIHLAVPFGVLASMANEEEGRKFLSIAETPRDLKEHNPGQKQSTSIVKECWRLRKYVEQSSPEAGVTWRDGVTSLGLTTLLPM